MSKYEPKEAAFDFAALPGRILQRELDAQSMSQAQLASRTGLSTKHINLVIKGTAALSPDVAVTLEQILGTSAETWLQLESAYQAHNVRAERRNALAGYANWARSFPREVLVERGLIARTDDAREVAAKLLNFFAVASPAAYEKTWLEPQASYKRSQLHSIDPNLTALWLRLSEVEARDIAIHAPTYDATKLRGAATALPLVTVAPVGIAFQNAQRLLLDAGVVLVFVPEIAKTRICGVSRWLNGTPMIAVTSRYKSLDGLWFTILHEIAHVLLHPKRSTFIDFDSKARDDDDAQETAANTFAQTHLIPESHRAALSTASTPADILAIASSLKVSPSLIAGQWAFQTGKWNGPIAKLRSRIDLADALAEG